MLLTARLLRDLVSLPSVNPMGRGLSGPEFLEYRVTAYLEDFFRDLGIPSRRQAVAPQRDNLLANWEAPGAQRTILFEVHQDTVPIDNMTVDPFGGTIDKGRLYGRGACDIKGGMAAMLGALTRLVRDRPAGAARILMACTVDEEHTFLGVQQLVSGGLQADLAVVAEPTSLNIVKAHKGVCRWHVVTQGLACHSSAPEQGINAIYRMGRLLEPIERYAEELRTRKVDPLLGPATLSIGRIEGGLSVNTVPDWCRIEVDRRLTPGEVPQAAQEEFTAWLRAAVPKDVPFTCLPLWMTCPALAPGGSEELVAQLGRCIDAVVGRHQVLAVPFGTDASTVAQAVIPTVVFGPGNIAQAHTCDEWVSLDEVEQASEILYRLVCEG